ncbi:MAG: YeiH family putative sulfate export transporter [Acetobacteraceae bacterium]|nr:YeiH family putative sulfate export transporter [Acetobacteraceae bacterium]
MQSLTLTLSRRSGWQRASGNHLLPGLFLTFTIAAAAFELRNLSGITALSPLIIAIVLGMILHNTVGTPAAFKPGVTFSMRRILRFAIVLLGLQLSLSQVVSVGIVGIAIIALTLIGTFFFTIWLGSRLGIDRKLAQLIAAGTSICGASAVIATNTVTRASDEDVAYAIAAVTVFGSASILLYPTLAGVLQLTPHAFGLWAGASIHEIAQVVAAAFQNGTDAGNFGTIVKLSRVMLLAPMILALGYFSAKDQPSEGGAGELSRRRGVPKPWFVAGFVAMMLFNSLDLIPRADRPYLIQATTFLLTVALAAMGLETDVGKLRARGWKPLLLGAGSWVFISVFSLALIEFL